MEPCETCGNTYERSFVIEMMGERHVFDSFECAIAALAPICSHCEMRIIGHGVEVQGQIFCCAHCARAVGLTGVHDHAQEPALT